MRRNTRELNIFSMSALDLFCSAMGAFLLLALIALPYYLKQDTPCEVCRENELPTRETQTTACPAPDSSAPTPAPRPAPDPAPECSTARPVAQDKLIVASIAWNRPADVDLHVLTPDGHFYFERREVPGRPGELYLDDLGDRAGEKRELWLSKDPTPGHYRFCVHWYGRAAYGSLPVAGTIYKPSGAVALQAALASPGACTCPVSFDLGADFVPVNVSTTPTACTW